MLENNEMGHSNGKLLLHFGAMGGVYMPRCVKCGKRSLFLKLSTAGICKDCYENELAEEKKFLDHLHAERKAQAMELERQKKKRFSYFRGHIFPTTSSNDSVQNAWEHWDIQIHDSIEQLKQQVKSLYEVIPISINTHKLVGYFSDILALGKIYDTTLTSCTCDQFKRTSKPCFHMYRLFSILSNVDCTNLDVVDIGEDYIAKFASLDDSQKMDFIFRIQLMDSNGRDVFMKPELGAEISAGLFVESYDVNYAPILSKMTKDEIILALAKKGIQGFRPSWSKVMLISWVSETQHDFLRKHFNNFVHISADPEVISWGKAISRLKNECTISHPYNWEELCKEADT